MSGSDLRRVLRFVTTESAGSADDPLPRSVLVGLRELLAADHADYFELRRADRAVLSFATSDDIERAPCSEETMVAVGLQNPLNWRRWHPSDGSLRLSAMISKRELQRRGSFASFMKRNRLRDTIKVWLWSSPQSAACVALGRFDTDFSAREQDLLGILQHHLIRMRERALAGRVPLSLEGVSLTPREAEVLTWAARGMANEEVAKMLGTSPATISKHMEHAYEKLGVHSRAEALTLLMASGSHH
ncbi:MAG: LuxR C-terminal-related transcriptional regulator [Candidatus Limnocylindria bacterium]